MLTQDDRHTLAQRNIPENRIHEQLARYARGFKPIRIIAPATPDSGILQIPADRQQEYIQKWDTWLAENHTALKFVPASGAATRMFRHIYTYLHSPRTFPDRPDEKEFFENIARFPFCKALNATCLAKTADTLLDLLAYRKYKDVLSFLLTPAGLNLGNLPKALLPFHRYPGGTRTALEEHLAEAALYTCNRDRQIHLHFTVSPHHQEIFAEHIRTRLPIYEKRFDATYNVTLSIQDPATDIIAADLDGQPFRDDDGALLFRPAGHGALLNNLNQLDADVIFIKNIDNVMPESPANTTATYRKLLAGILVTLRQQIFHYLRQIETGSYTYPQIHEMIRFLRDQLHVCNSEIRLLEDAELILYIRHKLARPLRVCGMVRNTGEPGGGPFFALNPDATVSLQILETAQIDLQDPETKRMFEENAWFNPVDMVCSTKTPDGKKYDLTEFVDPDAGLISRKSHNGRDLQALELPGLWNGAMSDWNTVFVELPASTFNPVKTVNDLLRMRHQPPVTVDDDDPLAW